MTNELTAAAARYEAARLAHDTARLAAAAATGRGVGRAIDALNRARREVGTAANLLALAKAAAAAV